MKSYLSLSACTSNSGFCDDHPDFRKDVWPLFLEYADSVESVYVESSPRFWGKIFGQKNALIDLGSMKSLAERQINEIKYKSYYGGHLSIFYKTADKRFLSNLIALFRRPPMIRPMKELNLSDTKIDLISHIEPSYALISFCHDGDPICLFGSIAEWTVGTESA